MKIISLSGDAGAGKTTALGFIQDIALKEGIKVERYHMAQHLVKALSKTYSIPEECFTSHQFKDKPILEKSILLTAEAICSFMENITELSGVPLTGKDTTTEQTIDLIGDFSKHDPHIETYRDILVLFAEKLVKKMDKKYFLKCLVRQVDLNKDKGTDLFIIDSIRFVEELKCLSALNCLRSTPPNHLVNHLHLEGLEQSPYYINNFEKWIKDDGAWDFNLVFYKNTASLHIFKQCVKDFYNEVFYGVLKCISQKPVPVDFDVCFRENFFSLLGTDDNEKN